MAPLPIIADTFRVAVNWNSDSGQIAENVMHIRGAGKSAAEVGAELNAAATQTMFAPMVTTAGANTATITPLDGSSATLEYELDLPPFIGTTDGDFLPACAVIFTLYTALRGRSYRGRLFLPFVGEAAVDDGALVTPSASDLVDPWATFVTTLIGDGFALVVASYKLALATDVTHVVPQNFLGTQRRRQTRLRFP